MYQKVTFETFLTAFTAANRRRQFTEEGLELLFDHLEECERESGTPIELDVIALCCDYREDTVEEIFAENDLDDMPRFEDEALAKAIQYLKTETKVIGTTSAGTIVYQSF